MSAPTIVTILLPSADGCAVVGPGSSHSVVVTGLVDSLFAAEQKSRLADYDLARDHSGDPCDHDSEFSDPRLGAEFL